MNLKAFNILLLCILLPFFGSSQKILFVGNSLTYSNSMPQLLEDLAAQLDVSIETTSLCYPNYGLEDHWNDGKLQKKIEEGRFDYVIFQQGPSSQTYGKESLLEYGGKIKEVCAENNTQAAYFMVWPSVQYYATFDGVIVNHTNAAKVNKCLLFPVGLVWQKYREEKHNIKLYGNDNFHPSISGSFLAALTIFHHLHPEKDLSKLLYEKCKMWVSDKASFNAMKALVNNTSAD